MKKKRVSVISILITIMILVSCSSNLMLRIAVIPISPKSALTMQFEKDRKEKHKQFYKITKNVPVEKATQGELVTWVVYNFGPFHFAKYEGEC